jgi:hypothetical protein
MEINQTYLSSYIIQQNVRFLPRADGRWGFGSNGTENWYKELYSIACRIMKRLLLLVTKNLFGCAGFVLDR